MSESTLTVPWRTDTGHDQLERWFSGRSVRFGDDPDYSRFSYSLPDCLWFQDVDGEVALVGCRSVGLRHGFSGAYQGVADVRFAVLGGTTDYGTVNGLRSELPGLGEWVGVSSIEESTTLDDGRRVKSVDVHLGSPDAIPLSRALGLNLKPSFRITRSPEVDATTLHDSLQIETLVRKPRPWIDHLRAHNSVKARVVLIGDHDQLLATARADWRAGAGVDDYRQHRPMVERAIAWLVAHGHRRVRYRGIERNQLGLAHRAAALNLRRLVNLGLHHGPTGWATT